jgi:hypothetical protein
MNNALSFLSITLLARLLPVLPFYNFGVFLKQFENDTFWDCLQLNSILHTSRYENVIWYSIKIHIGMFLYVAYNFVGNNSKASFFNPNLYILANLLYSGSRI